MFLTFFLSLIDPFPRTMILHPVSCSSCFAVIPRGPRILPTKLNCNHTEKPVEFFPRSYNRERIHQGTFDSKKKYSEGTRETPCYRETEESKITFLNLSNRRGFRALPQRFVYKYLRVRTFYIYIYVCR